MRTLRSLKMQLCRMFVSPIPMVCVLMIFALCCVTNVYSDPENGKGYSVATMLLSGDIAQFAADNQVVRENVVRSAMSSWLIMFAPVICVLPFVKSVSSEKSSLKRFEMHRCGKGVFAVTRLLVGMLTSAAILCVGYGLFIALSFGLFPSAAEVDENIVRAALHGMSFAGFYFSRLAGAFIMGAVCTLPAYIISIFNSNKYMMTCIPFMFLHFYNIFIGRLSKSISAEGRKRLQLFSFSGIFKAFESSEELYVFIAVIMLVVISAIIATTVLHRRCDCCE